MAITDAWIRSQIDALSRERERAKVKVYEAKSAFKKAQAEMDAAEERVGEAYELLDGLDDCIVGLRDELEGMETLEREAENQAAELAREQAAV